MDKIIQLNRKSSTPNDEGLEVVEHDEIKAYIKDGWSIKSVSYSSKTLLKEPQTMHTYTYLLTKDDL